MVMWLSWEGFFTCGVELAEGQLKMAADTRRCATPCSRTDGARQRKDG